MIDAVHRDVIVVIPTYNERANLPSLVEALLEIDPHLGVLIVDDDSPDGTGELADGLAAAHPGAVDVLHRGAKHGIGPAYRAGFAHALALAPRLIAQMDADHSHQPADLARLIEGAEVADVVLGSRYVPGGRTVGWPLARRLISQFGGIYARLVLRVPIHDLTGGFKVFRTDALRAINLSTIRSDGYVFQIETTYRAIQRRQRVIEIPITFVDRVAGKSKLSRTIVLEAMVTVWRLRFRPEP